MGTHHPIRKTVAPPPAPEIPDKLYFRIGDVARLCEVPAYVLRFWETEFPQLKPNKGGTGQRLYRRRDVEMALRIKSLLYEQGYTIPGARQVFKADANLVEARASDSKPVLLAPVEAVAPSLAHMRRDARLQEIRADLAGLLTTLSKPAAVETQGGPKGSKLHTMRPRTVAEMPDSQQLSLDGELF